MKRAAVACALAGALMPALAWIYPEHRDIAVLAVGKLDPERRAVFDRLWKDARRGDEARFCEIGADAAQGLAPACIDWAAWPAIAGDHACSGQQMLDTVRSTGWILQVADVAAQLKVDLARIPVTASAEMSGQGSANVIVDAQRRLASEQKRAERVNALRTADIRLQRADAEYATRAGANNAHFLMARPNPDTSPYDYASLTLRAGSEISAIGAYSYYHLSALQKASRLAREPLDAAQRDALTRAALADEAFALHFLQDSYAAGHITGTWGTPSQRQGTHDHYNQNGLEVFTWKGGSNSLIVMGDAHMRPEDAEVASAAARTSLAQVLDAAAGAAGAFPHTPQASTLPESYDVCRNNTLPERPPGTTWDPPKHRSYFAATLEGTPVPSLGPGLGSMPRFRSEVGRFVGLAGSTDIRTLDGGFVAEQSSHGYMGGLDLSVRAGFGLDGVTGEAGDGLVYASLGFRADSPSSNRFSDSSRGTFGGNLSAAIPARSGVSARLRMPYYLVPGDLLLLSPMYFFDPEAYTKLAVVAGNGGLLSLQSGWATPIGRFQFVLGREIGVTYYGGLAGQDQLIAPAAEPGGLARIVNFKSTAIDLPIAEYRPYRSFSMNQSSSVMFQLFAAADNPRGAQVVFPAGAPTPDLHTIWSVGLRMMFDWRYYY